MDLKLEVVVLSVSDVDRAKRFYATLGFREDTDYAQANFRVVQFTPPGSTASIIFGKGITSPRSGSPDNLVLAVDDVEAARDDFPAANGSRHPYWPRTSQLWQSSSTRPRNTTATTRRRTPSTTGGTGTLLI